MDTFIWGPPMWKVLHTLSFAHPNKLRMHKRVVVRFLHSLQEVLPCVYCRNSYASFLREMPDLGEVIDRGEMSRWMFELHSRVNAKLGVKDPEFSRVQKRYTIRPIQWCPGDVWDMVALFGINYTPQKSEFYRTWWETFIPILGIAGASPRMIALLKSVDCPCTDGAFVATSHVLANAYSGGETHVRRYELAKAKACKNGTCK
jgi:hypothetical protein